MFNYRIWYTLRITVKLVGTCTKKGVSKKQEFPPTVLCSVGGSVNFPALISDYVSKMAKIDSYSN
jgi:hypothetical protein